MSRPGRLASVCALAAAALLLATTWAHTADLRMATLRDYRRLWGDLGAAISLYCDHVEPRRRPGGLSDEAQGVALSPAAQAYRDILLDRLGRDGVGATTFWRTVRLQPFLRERQEVGVPTYEDPGRAWLLHAGFRLRGGVAPAMVFWLGCFCTLPVLCWGVAELVGAGRPGAAVALALLVGFSPFVVESLALGRSAVGFYLTAALLLVPLAAYACLGSPRPRGLLLRALAGGLLFAVAALCRSGAVFLLGGFVLVFAEAARRCGGERRARIILFAAALAAFSLPYVLVRPSRHHDVWTAVWEGLGDFDREKGYVWADSAAERVAQAAGAPALKTDASEAVLRARVLGDIRSDPGWYAGILARRVFSTISLRKLWPWAPLSGESMAPSPTANEGYMHKYYRYTATVEFVGAGQHAWELPVPVLMAPLLVLAYRGVRSRGAAGGGELRMVGAMAAATLPLPVLISTAAGQETQAFALTYLLAAALLVARPPRARDDVAPSA